MMRSGGSERGGLEERWVGGEAGAGEGGGVHDGGDPGQPGHRCH